MDSLSDNLPDPDTSAQDQPTPQPVAPTPPSGTIDASVPPPGVSEASSLLDDEEPAMATPRINLADPGTSTPVETPVSAALLPSMPLTPNPTPPGVEPAPHIDSPTKPPRGEIRWGTVIAIIVFLLALIGAGGWWYLTQYKPHPATSAPVIIAPSSSPTPSLTPTSSPSPSASASPSTSPTSSPSPSPASTPLSVTVRGQAATNSQQLNITGNQPVIAGKSGANDAIAITITPENISLKATADSSGSWSVTPSSDLPNGTHDVQVTATSVSGATDGLLSFGLVTNPVSANPTVAPANLAPTGDPVGLVSLIALFVLAAAAIGWRRLAARG